MFDAAFIEHLLLSSFLAKCCIKGERLDLAKTVINLQKEVKKKNSCFKSNNKKSLLWNVKTDVNYNKVLLIHGGGICGWVVNTTSAGPGFKPRPLHCFLRQRTLLHFVSLHPGVSWVPVTYSWGEPCDGLASCPEWEGKNRGRKEAMISSKQIHMVIFQDLSYFVILLPCSDLIECTFP